MHYQFSLSNIITLVCLILILLYGYVEKTTLNEIGFTFFFFCLDVSLLIKFLKDIEDGTVVMMATFDDSSTK